VALVADMTPASLLFGSRGTALCVAASNMGVFLDMFHISLSLLDRVCQIAVIVKAYTLHA